MPKHFNLNDGVNTFSGLTIEFEKHQFPGEEEREEYENSNH